MEKNDLIIMQEFSPELSLFLFAIIVLASKFNWEKGDDSNSSEVTDPNFFSRMAEFIESHKDQMLDYEAILNLANNLMMGMTESPFTTAIVAAILRFNNPLIWNKENQEAITFFSKQKKDNKLFFEEYRNNSLKNSIDAHKEQELRMWRRAVTRFTGVAQQINRTRLQTSESLRRARLTPRATDEIVKTVLESSNYPKTQRKLSDGTLLTPTNPQRLPLESKYRRGYQFASVP
jgi:hypothetical protein